MILCRYNLVHLKTNRPKLNKKLPIQLVENVCFEKLSSTIFDKCSLKRQDNTFPKCFKQILEHNVTISIKIAAVYLKIN